MCIRGIRALKNSFGFPVGVVGKLNISIRKRNITHSALSSAILRKREHSIVLPVNKYFSGLLSEIVSFPTAHLIISHNTRFGNHWYRTLMHKLHWKKYFVKPHILHDLTGFTICHNMHWAFVPSRERERGRDWKWQVRIMYPTLGFSPAPCAAQMDNHALSASPITS